MANKDADERFMRMALRAGRAGRPSPNPHVGAVVVRSGRVVSRGYHRKAGEAHAEVMALQRAGGRSRGATVYVTLEPCNHTGRTPPCTEALITAKVSRVVIGCRDPDPHVPGAVTRMRRAGISVTVGVCEQAARDLVADFRKSRLEKLPLVTMKAAVTLDGRIATRSGESRYITGDAARRYGQRMRDRSDAVMIGVGTAIADDPVLTVRDIRGRTPLRVVLDSSLRLPVSSALVRTAGSFPTVVYHGPTAGATQRRALTAAGVELRQIKRRAPAGRGGASGVAIRDVLRDLHRHDVVRVLVEGGAHVHGALLANHMADKAAVFVAPCLLGDSGAIPLAYGPSLGRLRDAFRLDRSEVTLLGDDVLIEGWLPRKTRK